MSDVNQEKVYLMFFLAHRRSPKMKFWGIFLRVRLAAEELDRWVWPYVCLDSLVKF